jgi:hypothetical protein
MIHSSAAKRFAAMLGLLSVAVLVPAAAAQASVSNTSGTITASGSCNRYTHKATMSGSIALSSRFADGAYVANRYAYWYVNPVTFRRISPTYTTYWLYSTVRASAYRVDPDLVISNVQAGLPSYTINTWGQLQIALQVGVWNGSRYEYSNWDTSPVYGNYGQFGLYYQGSLCAASVT